MSDDSLEIQFVGKVNAEKVKLLNNEFNKKFCDKFGGLEQFNQKYHINYLMTVSYAKDPKLENYAVALANYFLYICDNETDKVLDAITDSLNTTRNYRDVLNFILPFNRVFEPHHVNVVHIVGKDPEIVKKQTELWIKNNTTRH